MNENRLEQQFTPLSLLTFALPNIIMMIFLSLYTIVDGIFISRYVGTLALSATNMSYPLTYVQLAIAVMLGTGGSAVIARKMGLGKAEEAREDFTYIVATALFLGFLLAFLELFFLQQLLHFLGVSAAQMPECVPYTKILMYFSPMLFLQTVFQVFFVTAGKPHLGLVLTVLGGVANMVLDYLFMGVMHMGVIGAAIATGIGYAIPAVTGLIYFFFFRKGSLYFVKFRPHGTLLLMTCSNGISEFASNLAAAVTNFLFNIIFMKFWAEDGVAAITIILYFQFVFSAGFMGFSLGISPIISYKYGAGDTAQLKKIVRFSLGFLLACSIGIYLLSQITLSTSLGIFTESGGRVYNIAYKGFPVYALSFLLMGISIFASALFTAFSNGIVSAIISLARTFIFLVGCLLILPFIWGKSGIWFSVPLAEFLGILVSLYFLFWGRKKYQY